MTPDIQHIATQVATEYNRKPNDLKKKRYSKLTNIHEMKQDFVRRCYEQNIEPHKVAEFLDHSLTSVSRLANRSGFTRTTKHQRLLQRFRDRETVFIKPKNYSWIPKLRDKGHCIVNVAKYQYKLIT